MEASRELDPYRYIDRRQTVSEKWNKLGDPLNADSQSFVLTLADMDFPLSRDIQASMIEELSQPNVSIAYAVGDQAWKDTVAKWILDETGHVVNKDLLTECGGIFQFISVCLDLVVGDGGSYVALTPLCDVLINHADFDKKRLIESRLLLKDSRFQMNFEELQNLLSKEEVKLFLLVNPHSPSGRCWTPEELGKLVDIMERTGKYLLSDEIYSSLAYKPFTSMLKYADRLGDKLIVGSSPSKSFNVSGSSCGYGVLPNKQMLLAYEDIEMFKYTSFPTYFSIMTLKACYGHGKKWLAETKQYLQGNIELLYKTFRERFPKATVHVPDAGYAVLVDFSNYGVSSEVIAKMLRVHNIILSSMKGFFVPNSETALFRITVGCNRNYLERFLTRLEIVMLQVEAITKTKSE